MLTGLLKMAVLIGMTLLFSIAGRAEINSDARYFSGTVQVMAAAPSTCFVEVVYSGDLYQVTTRTLMTLPHLSPTGEYLSLALGPYTGSYLAAKSLYRYQDATVAAPVKDLVLNVTAQTTPTKLGVMYWHKQAGHHDPIFCENLVEQTTPEQLQVVSDQFDLFGAIQASNP